MMNTRVLLLALIVAVIGTEWATSQNIPDIGIPAKDPEEPSKIKVFLHETNDKIRSFWRSTKCRVKSLAIKYIHLKLNTTKCPTIQLTENNELNITSGDGGFKLVPLANNTEYQLIPGEENPLIPTGQP